MRIPGAACCQVAATADKHEAGCSLRATGRQCTRDFGAGVGLAQAVANLPATDHAPGIAAFFVAVQRKIRTVLAAVAQQAFAVAMR